MNLKNPFILDPHYKQEKTSWFKNITMEKKYQNFYGSRKNYQIIAYCIFKLIQIIALYFLQECYISNFYNNKCTSPTIMTISLIGFLIFIWIIPFFKYKYNTHLSQLFLSIFCLYSYIAYAEYMQNYHFSVVLIFIDQFFITYFTFFSLMLFYFLIFWHLTFFYQFLKYNEYPIFDEPKNEFKLILGLIFGTFAGFMLIDHNRRKNWVILDTFQRSRRFFLDILDHFSFPIFITDDFLNIVFTNKLGLILIQRYLSSDQVEQNLNGIIKNLFQKEDLLVFESMIKISNKEKKLLTKSFLVNNEKKEKKIMGEMICVTMFDVFIKKFKYLKFIDNFPKQKCISDLLRRSRRF